MQNDIAFIFGGSGLIGRSVINKILNKNLKVYNFDKHKTSYKNRNYKFIKVDLTNLHLLNEKIKLTIKKYGCPNKVVNCSYPNKTLFKTNLSFDKINSKNLIKALNGHLGSYIISSTIILNSMKRKKIKGSLVLLSSVYGLKAQDQNLYRNTGITESPIYVSVKNAINGFVQSSCSKFAKNNININSICPGGIENNEDKNLSNIKFRKNYISKVPSKRFAKVEEISEVIVFLLNKKKSSYINGVNLPIDGGLSII